MLLRVNVPRFGSLSVPNETGKKVAHYGSLRILEGKTIRAVGEVFDISDEAVIAKLTSSGEEPGLEAQAVKATDADILAWAAACKREGKVLSDVAAAAEQAIHAKGPKAAKGVPAKPAKPGKKPAAGTPDESDEK